MKCRLCGPKRVMEIGALAMSLRASFTSPKIWSHVENRFASCVEIPRDRAIAVAFWNCCCRDAEHKFCAKTKRSGFI